jgi:hypothetical protein
VSSETLHPSGNSQVLIDFFVAGVQKAGTTALDRYLRGHPDIQMAKVKEVHYFDDETIDWSRPDYAVLHSEFSSESAHKLRGEATPIYTYWPSSLERIQRYNSAAKIIVGLRHPSFRAYSHWRMEAKRGLDTLPFREAIDWPARDRVAGGPYGVHRVFSYVERGFYSSQIDRLLQLFPRKQVMFYRTDQLWSNLDQVLEQVQSFLGVQSKLRVNRTYIVPEDTWKPEEIHPADRLVLDQLFAGDIQRTSERAGISLTDWLDPNYSEPMRLDEPS